MSIRRFCTLSSLVAAGLVSIAACVAPTDGQGTGAEPSTATPATPENMPICLNCEPPMPAMPSSVNLGQIGALNDAMNGYRTFTVTVMAPKAGTLTATYLNSYGGQWKVLTITPVGGSEVSGGFPATVTAGQEVRLSLAFQADPGDTGVLNTELSIYNEGARTLIPVDVTTAWFYDPGPAINVYLSDVCGNLVGGVYQLGDVGGGTCGGTDAFKVVVNMVNLGNQAGSYQITAGSGQPFQVACQSLSGSLAPEQVIKDVCTVTLQKIPVIALDGGLGYVNSYGNSVSLAMNVTTPTQTWPFDFWINMIGTPAPASAGGGGSGTSSGSGGSGGGGTATCGSVMCSVNCGSGCDTFGPYCSELQGTSDLTASAQGDGCAICCDPSCMPSTCPPPAELSSVGVGVITHVAVAQ